MAGDAPQDAPQDAPLDAPFDLGALGHRVWLRLAVLVVLVAGLAWGVSHLDVSDPEALRGRLAETGAAAPLIVGLGYVLGTLGPMPRNVLSVAAGVLLGFWVALPVAYLASLVGAAAAYLMARHLGRGAVLRLAGRRLRGLDTRLERRGFAAVLAARVIPVIPFTAFNYSAGLSRIGARDYALGTILGAVPGVLFYVSVGASVTLLDWP